MNTKTLGAILFAAIMVTSMFVGFLALGATSVASAAEEGEVLLPGDIDGPGVIEESGTYTLTTDIDLGGTNVTAFEIKASNVVLDGQGHTISNGTAEAIHILSSGSGGTLTDITIKNFRITGVETAISAMNVENSLFTNLELVSNADAGMAIAGRSSTNNVIQDSLFQDNEKGIFLREGTSAMTIQNNDFIENHELAVKASGSSANEILNNYFDGQDGEKTIHLTGRSPDHVISGNEIINSDGPEYAIHIGGEATGTLVEDNVIAHNTLGGISVGPNDITIRDNQIYDNGDPGINVEGSNVLIENNDVYNNRIGVLIAGAAQLNGGQIYDNDEGDVVSVEDGAAVGTDVTIDPDTPVILSFIATNVGLAGAAEPEVLPADRTPLGKYFAAFNTSASDETFVADLYVEVHYTQTELSGVDEDTLRMWRHDGTDWSVVGASDGEYTYDYDRGEWITDVSGDTGVDTDGNFVWASIETFDVNGTIFGPIDGPAASAAINVTNVTVSPNPANASENVTIAATIENTGDFDATLTTVDLWVDGSIVETIDGLVVPAQDTATAEFVRSFAVGTYDIAVSGTSAGTLEVLDDIPPVAEAGPDTMTVGVNQTVTFDGTASTDNIGIVEYLWEFSDDGTTANTSTVDHVFTDVGNYTVTLTVTDTSGNTDTDTIAVEVVPDAPPVADAGVDRTVTLGLSTTFDGTGSFDYEGEIVSYEWDFGDNTTATGAVVAHTYTAVGNYTVTLTVTDEANQTDTDTVLVEVVPDTQPPVANAGADKQIELGKTANFNGGGSSDNVGIVSYTWTFGDGASGSGVTASHSYGSTGTYTVTLTVRDAAGNTASDTLTVKVVKPADDDDGTSPPPSGGGGGGGAPVIPGGTTNVDVTYAGSQARVSVQNAGENAQLRVEFQFQDPDACVNLEQLRLQTRAQQNFQFQVHQGTESPEQGLMWQARNGDPALGYFGVTHDGAIGGGTFAFQVRTDCLADAGIDAEHLRLYRYVDDGWERLQTRIMERNETHVRFEADTDGFSVFAIGYLAADVTVTEATLDPTQITVGDTATVSVTLENNGDVEGTYTVDLQSDGTTIETMDVTVGAGETRTVSLTHQFDTAGEYVLTVDGVTAGTLVVESPSDTTTTTTTTETPAGEETDGDGLGTWLLLGLLALAAVLVIAYALSTRGENTQ